MKNILGIVAEYNPFHNGHLYHINQAKKISGCDYTIAVMSGNFTQRGEPALMDKWARTEAALHNGIDLVIELPTLYAISSAENYAEGAIKILNSLGIVDNIAFGAENSDLDILENIAEILYKEPKEFKNLLSLQLKKGMSFPKAREKALIKYLKHDNRYNDVISEPNNILGIEYLKALKKYKSSIKPIAIERIESEHNDIDIDGNIVSAKAIRELIKNKNIIDLDNLMPKSSALILKDNLYCGHVVKGMETFEKEIIYTLRKIPTRDLRNIQDVSEGLENLLKKAANSCNTVQELIENVSSKRFTNTRIQRILTYSLLDITKKDMVMSKKEIPYARILGFNSNGKHMISEIVEANSKIKFIGSPKKFIEECSNKVLSEMLEIDMLATDIYTLGFEHDSKSNLDFTKKIVSI